MGAQIQHLHTYFLFPFWMNRELVTREHDEQWKKHQHWLTGLDECIAVSSRAAQATPAGRLGCWQRASYSGSDMDSTTYQDMVFFHPFVRRIFFDTGEDSSHRAGREALIRCYTIPLEAGRKVWLEAADVRGRSAKVQVTDLRLFLFANGMGILAIGVEAWNLSAADALWINETMRKTYPSSGRQIREGRAANLYRLSVEENGREEALVEERFENCKLHGFQPPLSKIITSLLYFLNFEKHEYEQLLDERMIVYSYAGIDPASVEPEFASSAAYEVLLSRFLYVDRDGDRYRYEPEFTREQMKQHVYRRWAHEGTNYGFTSYSNVTLTLGVYDRGEHVVKEGFLIHRMFDTRYYLMAVVALFYRATMLDFAQKTALVSRRLFRDQEAGQLSRGNIESATRLRSEFLHFSNYWYFEELANKDEEIEHFTMQCRAYRIGAMKSEVEQEIEKLNASLHEYHQARSTDAVNRLAMLSMILGAGAVLTGFFGMNFGLDFGRLFFTPEPQNSWLHYVAIAGVTAMAFGALAFGVYIVMSNPADYRDILMPRGLQTKPKQRWYSLKRSDS